MPSPLPFPQPFLTVYTAPERTRHGWVGGATLQLTENPCSIPRRVTLRCVGQASRPSLVGLAGQPSTTLVVLGGALKCGRGSGGSGEGVPRSKRGPAGADQAWGPPLTRPLITTCSPSAHPWPRGCRGSLAPARPHSPAAPQPHRVGGPGQRSPAQSPARPRALAGLVPYRPYPGTGPAACSECYIPTPPLSPCRWQRCSAE